MKSVLTFWKDFVVVPNSPINIWEAVQFGNKWHVLIFIDLIFRSKLGFKTDVWKTSAKSRSWSQGWGTVWRHIRIFPPPRPSPSWRSLHWGRRPCPRTIWPLPRYSRHVTNSWTIPSWCLQPEDPSTVNPLSATSRHCTSTSSPPLGCMAIMTLLKRH